MLTPARAATSRMVARGRGHVINLGSIAGHEVYPGGAVYCATKHAVAAITRGMRIDLVLASPPVVERTEWCVIDRNARKGKQPSDHAPVIVDLRD